MILQSGLRALLCGALVSLGAMSFARAEGTYEIPAGAHFNRDKLAKISEFFKNEVATGKIAGATVLIQQRGKPVFSAKPSACRTWRARRRSPTRRSSACSR
ncbi:hypothetical protein ACVWWG_008684 [Bradyrhizobium sp. LB7.2]